MSDTRLRVGLDLDGSLEWLSNSMVDLAAALGERGDLDLQCFRTLSRRRSPTEVKLAQRALWAPWWRRSRGRSLDTMLAPLDVIHIAGRATPPTKTTPLLISVDDLRPLRADKQHQRVVQLQRAVRRGAILVVSSRAASHEVRAAMGLARPELAVVRPPLGYVPPTVGGSALVVSITDSSGGLEQQTRDLQSFATRHHCELVVVASAAVVARLHAAHVNASFVQRGRTPEALARARCVVHISDGARFPSFAVAALAAGVPTLASTSAINRELLSGAAALVATGEETLGVLEDLWVNESRRAILTAAGTARASDFSPWTVASAYAALYSDVAKRHFA